MTDTVAICAGCREEFTCDGCFATHSRRCHFQTRDLNQETNWLEALREDAWVMPASRWFAALKGYIATVEQERDEAIAKLDRWAGHMDRDWPELSYPPPAVTEARQHLAQRRNKEDDRD